MILISQKCKAEERCWGEPHIGLHFDGHDGRNGYYSYEEEGCKDACLKDTECKSVNFFRRGRLLTSEEEECTWISCLCMFNADTASDYPEDLVEPDEKISLFVKQCNYHEDRRITFYCIILLYFIFFILCQFENCPRFIVLLIVLFVSYVGFPKQKYFLIDQN